MLMRPILAILLCVLPFRAEAARNPEAIYQISAEEERRIQKGAIIVHVEETDEPIKRTLVTGLVDAPPEQVYAVYTDFERYPELFKTARSSEVVGREGHVLTCKVVMDFPWPLGSRWVSNHTILDPARTSFTFKKVEGSVKIYEGALVVQPEPGSRSRVVYSAKVAPNLPVPAWLVNKISAHYFPMAIERVRDRVARKADRPGPAK